MFLPYIKSMEAAAKMANNADLLMLMRKSDSEEMTAPESGMCALDGDLTVSLGDQVLVCPWLQSTGGTVDDAPKSRHRTHGCQEMIV